MLQGVRRVAAARTRLRTVLASRAAGLHSSPVALERILCSDPIDGVCAKILRERGHTVDEKGADKMSPAELKKIIGEYDGLIVRSGTTVTADVMEAGHRLKLIGRAGVGVDNIDVPEATRRGILVMNTPGGNTTSAAELAMTLVLALSRSIPQACLSLKEGKWDRKKFTGTEIAGKTIGIVGLGRIGREVGRWCRAFGMTVVGYDPLLAPEVALADGIQATTLDDLYARSDFISLHTPMTKDTKNLLNSATFRKCKRGVRLVNCARGGIINEADLLEALESGQVGGAALDVFEQEPPSEATQKLLAHPNVICTPHIGASTHEAQLNVARDIAIQFADALDRKKFVGVVNAAGMDYVSRPDLVPFLSIAERLGSLQAQLLGSKRTVRGITVILQGTTVSEPSVAAVIKTAVLKGFLSHMMAEQGVNFINTPMLAQKAGVTVQERLDTKPGSYSNLITVQLDVAREGGAADGSAASAAASASSSASTSASTSAGADGSESEVHRFSATVFSPTDARLVEIDGFKVDIDPSGDMLFFNNQDRPGVLKDVTSVLGAAGINIAFFGLGRHSVGGEALGVLALDSAVPADALERIRKLDAIKNVRTAALHQGAVGSAPRVVSQAESSHVVVPASAARKPTVRPASAHFGSGPTKKRPGWTLTSLVDASVGRSHRSKTGKAKLKLAIDMTKDLLQLPKDYLVGIVPGSDTGAFEMAMWTMLGERPVDVAHWESFGKGWYDDAVKELKLPHVHEFKADYGLLPDLSKINKDHDLLFTWNGTTSGVRVPNGDFIAADRKGLTFVDATSAVFAQRVEFPKADVLTYSWQKVLGGEGAHGMLVLSPRAVERLESFTPTNRPMPKVFRLTKKGKLQADIFEGSTINTPSMLCVEDYLDSLKWAESLGGLDALVKRADDNLAVIEKFVAENSWIHFLPKDPATRSNTSVCLSLDLPPKKVKDLTKLLEAEGIAFDIDSYRDAPAGLRIWCGATVETADLEALMPWLHWAYHVVSE